MFVSGTEQKRSVNVLLGKIENFCEGEQDCFEELMDDLINYLYDGQLIGTKINFSDLKFGI